jgi:hypothetical protein
MDLSKNAFFINAKTAKGKSITESTVEAQIMNHMNIEEEKDSFIKDSFE